jgi:hypothetical protein
MESPETQRGGTTPGDEELQEKGQWAEGARDGIAPRDAEADADRDPSLGRTTGSDEPATEEGIDREAGDEADATTDGHVELPDDAEPDLKDAMGAHQTPDAEKG